MDISTVTFVGVCVLGVYVYVGIPQLSMHSIREMCGVSDVFLSYQLLHHIYHELSHLDQQLTIQYEQ